MSPADRNALAGLLLGLPGLWSRVDSSTLILIRRDPLIHGDAACVVVWSDRQWRVDRCSFGKGATHEGRTGRGWRERLAAAVISEACRRGAN